MIRTLLMIWTLVWVPLDAVEANHVHHGGHDHALELGFSLGAVKLSHEEAWLGSLHLHLSHRLAEDGLGSRLALGLGLETLVGGEPHTALMGALTIYPWKGLAFSLSPGILWAREEGGTETRFLLHMELSYGFELWGLEAGPMAGIAFAGEDRHIGIGLHLGKGF